MSWRLSRWFAPLTFITIYQDDVKAKVVTLFQATYQRFLPFFLMLFATCIQTSYANTNNHQAVQKNTTTHQTTLRVAVAANFSPILKTLLTEFQQLHHINVDIISGASGVLYQQIISGAPYDVFLSADSIRPEQLVAKNVAIENSLHTYAIGQLAFWDKNASIQSLNDFINVAENATNIAIANPNIAPYGIAAKQALENLQLFNKLKTKLVLGVNVNQTFQQLRTGAVHVGIVAASQLTLNKLNGFILPSHLYSPIKQQLVILQRSKYPADAQTLVAFLLSDDIQAKVANYGYITATSLLNNTGNN